MPKPDWHTASHANHAEYVRRASLKGKLTNNEEVCRFLSMALAGEAGELANLFKKEWRGDGPVDRDKVADEMADVRIYLEHLASDMSIDLDAACAKKVAIVATRL